MTELVARLQSNAAGAKMRRMFERATLPLRKVVWWVEETLIWPVSNAIHRRSRAHRIGRISEQMHRRSRARLPRALAIGEPAAPESLSVAAPQPVRAPGPGPDTDRSQAPHDTATGDAIAAEQPARPRRRARGDLRIAAATAVAAAAAGVGIAVLVGGSGAGGGSTSSSAAPAQLAGSPAPPPTGPASATKRNSSLAGVAPSFKAAGDSSAKAGAKAGKSYSPTKGTNSKPSSIPAAPTGGGRALQTARAFSGAFVLYEIGRTSAKARHTLAATATPSLAKSLRARPPRLPASVKVPKAKVQNVVLGKRKGREVEASVSLLRLGQLSELRLTLTRHHGAWAVSEVKG